MLLFISYYLVTAVKSAYISKNSELFSETPEPRGKVCSVLSKK
jgi:hypothetical protein